MWPFKKKKFIPIWVGDIKFFRVLNTLKENKIMVKANKEGVFIRFAGNEDHNELFSLEWIKVCESDITAIEQNGKILEDPTIENKLDEK